MIKKIFLTLLFLFGAFHAFADRVAVPSGTIRWDNFRDNYFNVQTAELYNFLGAVDGELPATPTFPSLQISGSGNSWLELENNSAWTDVLTWGYGFQGGIPYAIVDGTPARLALYSELAAGDTSVIQDDDPTLASATGKYYSRASGGYFNVVHGVEMFAIAGTRTADETDPVIGDITPSSITHDGTGVSLSATIASVTETYENYRQWSLYDVTADAVKIDWSTFTGLSIPTILIPADQHEYRVDVRAYDLAGNVGSASSAGIVYSGGAECATETIDQEYAETNGDYQQSFSATAAKGFSFTPTVSGELSSISFYSGLITTAGILTMRVGSSTNLNTYGDEVTGIPQTTANVWVNVPLNTKISVSAGVPVYVGFLSTQGSTKFYRDDTGGSYIGGLYYTADTGQGWNMNIVLSSGFDVCFRSYMCD